MADEHICVFETDLPIPFTCSDSTGIEKGSILKLADPMTVSAAAAFNDIVGGIAAEEKIASNGKVKIGVYRCGIFKAKASGSITAGDSIVISGPTANNLVETAAVNAEHMLGIALETVTTGETILYELKPITMQLA